MYMLHQCFSILVLLLCSNRLIFRMSWLQREAPCWSPQIMVLPGCSAIASSAPRAPNYNPAASTPCVRDPEGLCGDKIRHERGLLCGKPGRFSTTFVRGTRSYFAKWGPGGAFLHQNDHHTVPDKRLVTSVLLIII